MLDKCLQMNLTGCPQRGLSRILYEQQIPIGLSLGIIVFMLIMLFTIFTLSEKNANQEVKK